MCVFTSVQHSPKQIYMPVEMNKRTTTNFTQTFEKIAHISANMCVYSTSQYIHTDAQDYFVHALSLASATGGETSVCARTME